jgi:hypothetical protein
MKIEKNTALRKFIPGKLEFDGLKLSGPAHIKTGDYFIYCEWCSANNTEKSVFLFC